jgi:hypothetical protein
MQHPIYGESTVVMDKETNIHYIMKRNKMVFNVRINDFKLD